MINHYALTARIDSLDLKGRDTTEWRRMMRRAANLAADGQQTEGDAIRAQVQTEIARFES